MGGNKFLLMVLLVVPFATSAYADCLREEQIALADPGVRRDLRGLQLTDIQAKDATTLKTRLQAAEARAGSVPAAALYACLARLEMQRREGNTTTVADDPKAQGRSARVM